MKVLYETKGFKESQVVSRYIAWRPTKGDLVLFETNLFEATIRESVVEAKDYPPEKVAQAKAQSHKAFNQVRI